MGFKIKKWDFHLVEALAILEHARGVPGNCALAGTSSGYDATRTDDCVFADGDSAEQSRTGSDRGAAFDKGSLAMSSRLRS